LARQGVSLMHILLWARLLPEHQSPEWGFSIS
jgi:hypothetical protein